MLIFKSRGSFFTILAIFAITVAIFFPSINYYFFQDDWFILNRLTASDILKFILLKKDVIYWRPLGIQGFFFLSKTVFNLNPIPYHAVIISVHLLNGLLIYDLLSKIIKIRKQPALVSTLVYLTGSFHFMSLSWISLSWVTLGTFFLLTSIKYYFRRRNIANFSIAYVLFLLAMASTEFAIMYVPLLFIISRVIKQEKFTKSIKFYLVITSLSTFFYGTFRLISSNFQTEYQIVISLETVKNIFWYFLWFFNFPEQLREQLIITKFQFTTVLIRDAGKLLYFVTILPLMTICTFIYVIIWKRINIKYYLLPVLFVAFLLPVLFLKNHSYPYYLSSASLPLVIFMGILTSQIFWNRFILSLFVLLWIASSSASMIFNYKLHWVSKEQKIAKEAVLAVTSAYYDFPRGGEILLLSHNTMLEQALFSNEAFRVLYRNKDLTTKYYFDLSGDRFVYPVFFNEFR